jgi:nicotinamide-nucleotide amidase
VKFPEVLLKLVGRADTEVAAVEKVNRASSAIRERLRDVVYAEGGVTLPEAVGLMLKEKKLTISVAESCTGGLISSMITDVPGSSEYFERGIVAYSNKTKMEVLGVPKTLIDKHGAVSGEVAAAMAEGVRSGSSSSIGLSVTGIAGPGGGSAAKPVGTVHIALADAVGVSVRGFNFERDRLSFKSLVAATALDLVRKRLLGLEIK